MVANELEFLAELETEQEEEAGEMEVLVPPLGATAPKCNNRGIPSIERTQSLGAAACSAASAGVPDPIGVLTRVRNRALQMLDSTIGQLVTGRRAVCERGANPASQLSAVARCWLRNGMGVNTSDVRVWTAGTFEPIRSIAEVIRRLTRVRNLLGSRGLRYSCTGAQCPTDPEMFAYVTARDQVTGLCLPKAPLMLIRLCRPFWIPGTLPNGKPVTMDAQREFQSQTLIHEASHLTHCNDKETGRTIAVPECLAQFVAVTNDSPLDPRFLRFCAGTEPCRQPPGAAKVFQGESEVEAALEVEFSEDPFPLPQWPTRRQFSPPLQTVPLTPLPPFEPYVPCGAILDDITNLSMALGELEKALREKPSNTKVVNNRSDVVKSLAKRIVSNLGKTYASQHCTREDLRHLAIAVDIARKKNLKQVAGTLQDLAGRIRSAERKF